MTSAPLVEGRALSKSFGTHRAVDGIDFRVEPGQIFGFLGPNGAGKSSTMRMIACVSPITSGSLRVLDMNPVTDGAAIRQRIGVVAQEDNLDLELTVWDNLFIYGRYFGVPSATIRQRADELLDFVQLQDRRDDRVDVLSGGMRRRLAVARSLINRPDLVLLDEPTTGLDPQARHLLWERLYQLKRSGVTLIITTHYMDEAEQLCDRLVIMDSGRIVAEGSPRELIEQHTTAEVVEVRLRRDEDRAVVLANLDGIGRSEALADRIIVYTDDGDAAKRRIGVDPASVLVRRGTLEDVFLHLTGRMLEE